MTLEEYKKKKNKNDGKGFIYLTKLMITILITIITLLILKIKPDLKSSFYEHVFHDQISFVQVNEFYEKYLKDVLPFQDLWKVEPVFQEKKHIIMKTDNRKLMEYSIKSFTDYGYQIEDICLDLYREDLAENIPTEYEKKFVAKGCPIYKIEVKKD